MEIPGECLDPLVGKKCEDSKRLCIKKTPGSLKASRGRKSRSLSEVYNGGNRLQHPPSLSALILRHCLRIRIKGQQYCIDRMDDTVGSRHVRHNDLSFTAQIVRQDAARLEQESALQRADAG